MFDSQHNSANNEKKYAKTELKQGNFDVKRKFTGRKKLEELGRYGFSWMVYLLTSHSGVQGASVSIYRYLHLAPQVKN
ncbi:MAG: hypothetical protein LBH32_08280 [Dysgonamonadaceae bacterium]|jgi:hypothetical protein|nr:hypothetical protein [Dysgonamonadaceae bacterium]